MTGKELKKRIVGNGGFTLVELLISVAILAIIVVPIMTAFVSAANANSRARRKLEATTAAQNVMEEIKASGVNAYLASITPAPTPAADGTYTLDNTDSAAADTALISQQLINNHTYRFKAVFNPTVYSSQDVANPDYNDVSVANISDMNVLTDAFFVESEADDQKIVKEYKDENEGLTEVQILAGLSREMDVVISHTGTKLSKVRIDCIYSLTGYASKTVSSTVYDNSDVNNGNLRSIYIFYTPIYSLKGANSADTIKILNNTGTSGKESWPVDVYLVKQHTTTEKEAFESTYQVKLEVREENNQGIAWSPDAGFSAYTNIRTNIGYALDENSAGSYKELPLQWSSAMKYTCGAFSVSGEANCKKYLGLNTLDDSSAALRLYKVTLSVYGENSNTALYTLTGTAES